MAAGIMAGFGLWGSMFPIDTIKSKMQVSEGGGVVAVLPGALAALLAAFPTPPA